MPSSNAPAKPLTSPPGAAHGLPESDWRAVLDRELYAALSSFAAGVAHEARNQIFALTATLDAFETRFSGAAEPPRHFGVMREDLLRLTTLMHGLAEFAHPSMPLLGFGWVGDAVRDALASVGSNAARKGVIFHAELDDTRATAWFDRARLGLALGHLLDHAIRRSAEAEPVTISIARGQGEEGLVTVSIEDRGPALDPEHIDRLFEPFFSPNRAPRGLDLALAKRIVEQHGGSLHATSRGAAGVRCAVLIPGSGGP